MQAGYWVHNHFLLVLFIDCGKVERSGGNAMNMVLEIRVFWKTCQTLSKNESKCTRSAEKGKILKNTLWTKGLTSNVASSGLNISYDKLN